MNSPLWGHRPLMEWHDTRITLERSRRDIAEIALWLRANQCGVPYIEQVEEGSAIEFTRPESMEEWQIMLGWFAMQEIDEIEIFDSSD